MVSQSPEPLSQSGSLEKITQLETAAKAITTRGQDRSQRQYVVIDREGRISSTSNRSEKSDIRVIMRFIKKIHSNLDSSAVSERTRLLSVSHKITQQYLAKRESFWDRVTRACSSIFSSRANRVYEETTKLIDTTKEALESSILETNLKEFLATIPENGIIDTQGTIDRFSDEEGYHEILKDDTLFAEDLLDRQPNYSWLIERRSKPETKDSSKKSETRDSTSKKSDTEYYFHQVDSSSDSGIRTIHIRSAEDLELIKKLIQKKSNLSIDKNTANRDKFIRDLGVYKDQRPRLFNLLNQISNLALRQYQIDSSKNLYKRLNVEDHFFHQLTELLPEASIQDKRDIVKFLKKSYFRKLGWQVQNKRESDISAMGGIKQTLKKKTEKHG